MTEDDERRVMEATLRGFALDPFTGLEVPFAVMNTLFIRPGAEMIRPNGCTMNFIYNHNGSLSIGSAGHCNKNGSYVFLRVHYMDDVYLQVWVGRTNGSHDNGVGDDWSLTPIHPNLYPYVDTDVAEIFGPQGGTYTGGATIFNPKPIKHFGHGMGIGTGGTPRAGLMQATSGSKFYFNSPSIFGDSGSPVLLAGDTTNPLGKAVGDLTHLVIIGSGFTVTAGTRATHVKNIANATVLDGDGDPFPPP